MHVIQHKSTYLSRSGRQRLDFNLANPELKGYLGTIRSVSQFTPTLEKKIEGVINNAKKQVGSGASRDAMYRQKRVTVETFSATAGVLFSSSDTLEQEQSVGLGRIIKSKAGVCREVAMYTHLGLAALGVETVYVAGTLNMGGNLVGHCWLEFIEPVRPRVEIGPTVIDGTWGRIYIHGSYESLVHERIKEETYFSPSEPLDKEDVCVALSTLGSETL